MISQETMRTMISRYRVFYTHPFRIGLPKEFWYLYDPTEPRLFLGSGRSWYGKGLGGGAEKLHNGIGLGPNLLKDIPSSEISALETFRYGIFKSNYTGLRCYESPDQFLSQQLGLLLRGIPLFN